MNGRDVTLIHFIRYQTVITRNNTLGFFHSFQTFLELFPLNNRYRNFYFGMKFFVKLGLQRSLEDQINYEQENTLQKWRVKQTLVQSYIYGTLGQDRALSQEEVRRPACYLFQQVPFVQLGQLWHETSFIKLNHNQNDLKPNQFSIFEITLTTMTSATFISFFFYVEFEHL